MAARMAAFWASGSALASTAVTPSRRKVRQFTQRRTNSRSHWPVSSRWPAMARSTADSLPGHVGSQQSLLLAVLDRRGSRVTIFAPLAFASMMRWACGLK
jgi:hypothetical protein